MRIADAARQTKAAVRQLVEERADLVRSASRWNGDQRSGGRRPRSRDQVALASAVNGSRVQSAAEFAATTSRHVTAYADSSYTRPH